MYRDLAKLRECFSALQRAEIAEIERVLPQIFEPGFSALQRAEIAEMRLVRKAIGTQADVSVLFNEPKLLKSITVELDNSRYEVSVLFNEPKLLKSYSGDQYNVGFKRFSALQRAEIAEILLADAPRGGKTCFSALQRAEIAEIHPSPHNTRVQFAFQCSSTSRNC